jgi:hypothetical protein
MYIYDDDKVKEFWLEKKRSHICVVMVSVMATTALICGFKTLLSQLKDY